VALPCPAVGEFVRQGCQRLCAKERPALSLKRRHRYVTSISGAFVSHSASASAAPLRRQSRNNDGASHTPRPRTPWLSRPRLRDSLPTRTLLSRRRLPPATLCHTLPPLLAHTRGRKAPCRRLPLLLSILPSTHPRDPSPRPRRTRITARPHSPPICLPFSHRHACPHPVPHRHRAPNHPVLITSAYSHMMLVAT
jgi:hypothetical protein